jgi:hypothetical protein
MQKGMFTEIKHVGKNIYVVGFSHPWTTIYIFYNKLFPPVTMFHPCLASATLSSQIVVKQWLYM